MRVILAEVKEKALALDENERAELAETLISSLDEGHSQEEIEKAWILEVEQRYQNYLEGKEPLIPMDEAIQGALDSIS